MCAIQVDLKSAVLPKPSDSLFLRIAVQMYEVNCYLHMDENMKALRWDQLPAEIRCNWIEMARTAYAVIAIEGGGQRKEIPTEKD